jgi:hypothetical protein
MPNYDDDEPDTNSPEDLGHRKPPPAALPRPKGTTPKVEEPAKEEGARSFAVLMRQLQEGDYEGEVSEKFQELVARLGAHAERFSCVAKGHIDLKLNVTAEANGVFTVVPGDIRTKWPLTPRAKEIYYLTKGKNLTRENPRQQKLPLREVPQTKTQAKDINANADRPVREV